MVLTSPAGYICSEVYQNLNCHRRVVLEMNRHRPESALHYQADLALEVEHSDPEIAWQESHISQSGTRTRVVSVN